VLRGGLLAGGLDLAYALVHRALAGSTPLRVLQSIASGLLGRPAYEGGWATAALGVVLHFSIATAVAGVYFAASRRMSFLARHPVLSGALYGVAVYLVMYRIVLPLSAIPWKMPSSAAALVSGLAAHVCCIGIPIAAVVRRADSRRKGDGRG
jgi:uncharacterized membrane protein YagU involved in acid resistance